MTLQFSLNNPNMLKTLRLIRISLLAVVILGSATGAYSLYNARRTVNAETQRVESFRRQINEMREVLTAKRKVAALADTLRTEPPDGAGSGLFIQQVNHLAEQMHLDHFTLRMMDSAPRPQQAPVQTGAQKQGGNNTAAQPPNAPAANGAPEDGPLANWSRSGFEAEVAGEFRDLSDFLKKLAAIPFVVEVASIEVHPLGSGAKNRSSKLLMRLSGTLYGLPDKTEQK